MKISIREEVNITKENFLVLQVIDKRGNIAKEKHIVNSQFRNFLNVNIIDDTFD